MAGLFPNPLSFTRTKPPPLVGNKEFRMTKTQPNLPLPAQRV